jgi:hypothetical protein
MIGWHYQARKCEHDGEIWFDLVEVFPSAQAYTEKAVSVRGDNKQALADWLRKAADDVEQYDAIGDE